MRIVLIGRSSFIARHVLQEASVQGLDAVSLPHDSALAPALAGADMVVNFAVHPAVFSEPYAKEKDWDLRVAQAAVSAGVHFAMCSTRRVYGPNARLGATETSIASGDETQYGRSKAMSEKAVMQIAGGRCTIFRLSNIFGFEYSEHERRRSFFAQLLGTLRREKTIYFDMSAHTRRDFLPVELCALALVQALRKGVDGIFNLGCGFPVRCGELAEWVIEGFGGGRLVIEPDEVRDEFFLDMHKWLTAFPPLTSEDELRGYCLELGRRLRNA